MAMKDVIMRSGNGKSVSLPSKVADGLVRMRKARYPDEPKPKATVKKKEQPKPKTTTYQTRALQAEKPSVTTFAQRFKKQDEPEISKASDSPDDN